jgi:hypothetical protein
MRTLIITDSNEYEAMGDSFDYSQIEFKATFSSDCTWGNIARQFLEGLNAMGYIVDSKKLADFYSRIE